MSAGVIDRPPAAAAECAAGAPDALAIAAPLPMTASADTVMNFNPDPFCTPSHLPRANPRATRTERRRPRRAAGTGGRRPGGARGQATSLRRSCRQRVRQRLRVRARAQGVVGGDRLLELD